MPTDDLDLDDPEIIKSQEAANDFPSGTITKVTPLLRKDKDPSNKTKLRSIVIYLKHIHIANKWGATSTMSTTCHDSPHNSR